MSDIHIFLFAFLIFNKRIQVRSENENILQWRELAKNGFCTIFESGRRGTLVIHPTESAENLRDLILQKLVK